MPVPITDRSRQASPGGLTVPVPVADRSRQASVGLPTVPVPAQGPLHRRTPGPAVSVVLPRPATDAALAAMLTALAALRPAVHEVVVVGARPPDPVLHAGHPTARLRTVVPAGPGHGAAVARGFAVATGDAVVALVADGSARAAEVPALVAALVAGADVATGSRYAPGGSCAGLTLFQRIGDALVDGLADLLFGTAPTDLCHGSVALWADVLPVLDLPAPGAPAWTRGTAWSRPAELAAMITSRTAAAGLDVREVAVLEGPRAGGEPDPRTFTGGLRAVRTLVGEHRRARRSPALRSDPQE